MAETKFTPGPWCVALNSNDIPCIVQGPTQRVASAYFDGRDGSAWSKQVAAANAALIAAAPDLYATLAHVSAELKLDRDYALYDEGMRALVAKIDAALSKALPSIPEGGGE